MNEWREEQGKIRSKIERHENAHRNYLDEGIKLLELSQKAYFLYEKQDSHQKARLLKIIQSNCTWDGVSICPTYRKPFDILAKLNESEEWCAWKDSNLRLQRPERCALSPELQAHASKVEAYDNKASPKSQLDSLAFQGPNSKSLPFSEYH
jgi:hypothetical protein